MYIPTPEEIVKIFRQQSIYNERSRQQQVCFAVETLALSYHHLRFGYGIDEKRLETLCSALPDDLFNIAARLKYECDTIQTKK